MAASLTSTTCTLPTIPPRLSSSGRIQDSHGASRQRACHWRRVAGALEVVVCHEDEEAAQREDAVDAAARVAIGEQVAVDHRPRHVREDLLGQRTQHVAQHVARQRL